MKPIRTIEKLAYGEGTPDELADMMEAELAELRSRVTALEEAAPEPDMPTDVQTRTFRVPTFEELGMTLDEQEIRPRWGTPDSKHAIWGAVRPGIWLAAVFADSYSILREFPDVESARVFLGMLICPEVVFGL